MYWSMKTIINIRADKETEEAAQKLAKKLGLPLSTVINAYLKQFIRNEEVYFYSAPRMTFELEKIIGVARKDFIAKKNISPALDSARAVNDYLDSV